MAAYLVRNALALASLFFVMGCSGRNQLYWENDVWSTGNRDDNYTNGVQIAHSPNDETTLTVGQQIYTPDDLRTPEPIEDDRPYAGWLGVGYNRHNTQKTADQKDSQETLGVRVGCTGACSLAEPIQKFVHDDLDLGTNPQGWDNQIDMEPTIAVSYEYLYRPLFISTGRNFAFDSILKVRGDLGTDITRATIGPTFRFGYKLPNDFGPDVIEPTGYETYTLANKQFRIYGFARADGKGTLYNIFIDNHLFNSGTALDLEAFGADLAAGLAVHLSGFRVNFQFVWRTKEFEGDSDHKFGSIMFGWDI